MRGRHAWREELLRYVHLGKWMTMRHRENKISRIGKAAKGSAEDSALLELLG
jgi:hypothetical protein